MSIVSFFASLLPSFERGRIIEDIESLQKQLKENLLPSIKTATELRPAGKWQAPLVQQFDKLFVYVLPEYSRLGFAGGTQKIFEDLPHKLDLLEKEVNALFGKDITKETVTYRKANVLRFIELARFATEYATKSLLRFIAAESCVLRNKADLVDTQLVPAELRWLDENRDAYFQVLKILATPASNLIHALEAVPDVAIVPERADVVKETVGANKLDPLKMGFIGVKYNPIYHIRMAVAEAQVMWYKHQQEEKRVLELRLLDMKKAIEGKEDPKLQQAIEYNEGRLQKLNAELAQKQEDYGV